MYGYPNELIGSHLRYPELNLMRLFYFPNLHMTILFPESSTSFHDLMRQSMEYIVTHMLLSFLQLLASNADGKD